MAAPLRAADLKLEIHDGRVTLVAHDVPARQILTEWARLGQTKIDNIDKLPGTLLTLQLEGVTEKQALEIVLRNASGYMAKPRTQALAGASTYDRIVIMPPSTAVASAAPSPRPLTGAPPPPPTFRPGGFPAGDAPDDQDTPVPQPNVAQPVMPINPGMPGYVPPPVNVAQPGAIPQYPNGIVTLPNGQQVQYPPNYPQPVPNPQAQPQPNPQNPFIGMPGGALPGVITVPQPGVPVPGVPVKKPGGQPQ
jgi:hypothetical protein